MERAHASLDSVREYTSIASDILDFSSNQPFSESFTRGRRTEGDERKEGWPVREVKRGDDVERVTFIRAERTVVAIKNIFIGRP